MDALRVAAFVLQTALALATGLAAAPRFGAGRAVGWIVVTLAWCASIVAPAYVLAMAHTLTFWALAASSIAACAASLAILRPKHEVLLASARALALAPFDVLRAAWRRKSLVLVGLVFALGVYAWTAVTAWLAPQRPDVWDPFWYHEPMTAYAIQNRSFAPIDLDFYFQRINAFPRDCETITAWLVMVFGRRLVDFANLTAVPGLMSAVYLLCRRVSKDVVTCAGWGALVFVMPATLSLVQTSHYDTMAMFFLTAGIWFATSRTLSASSLLGAGLAFALGIGAKTTCLFTVVVFSAYVVVRLALARRSVTQRMLAAMAVGAALVVAMGSVTYVRNLVHFKNPFWPEMKVDIPALGISWPGRVPYRVDGPRPAQRDAQVDENIPMPELVEYVYAVPNSVTDYQYKDTVNYGIGIAWIVVPLALIGVLVLGVSYVVLIARGRGREPPARQAAYALLLAAYAVAVYCLSPLRWCAKYHVAALAMGPVIIMALAQRSEWRKVGEGACGAALVCCVMNFWWASPRYWCTWTELKELARLSPLDREVATSRAPYITAAFGRMREELQDGDLLLTRKYGLPGLLWNNEYSNRVEYVGAAGDLYDLALARGAACVVVKTDEPELAKFRADAKRWREATAVDRFGDTIAFRRSY